MGAAYGLVDEEGADVEGGAGGGARVRGEVGEGRGAEAEDFVVGFEGTTGAGLNVEDGDVG